MGEELSKKVKAKAARKLKARRERGRGVWFALGMIGLIGWSVVTPALIGIAMGLWIDSHWPSRISWTLTLLVIGLVLGCINAWQWISQEQKRIERDKEEEENDT